jgi:hypothetical protein
MQKSISGLIDVSLIQVGDIIISDYGLNIPSSIFFYTYFDMAKVFPYYEGAIDNILNGL